MSDRVAPTTTGMFSGVDAGTPWAFEPADEHWRLHDQREVAYWCSRPPEERLAQAQHYRERVHGQFAAPTRWSWRFVAPDE
ncbi:MAG: hypothetical protein HY047_07445 [Acidobacteria bacterium]|nr:hypothetical protein [Acidobacteriota bacterium]